MDLRLEHQRVKNKGGPGGINARIKLQRVGVQNKASGRYIRKITFLLTTVVYLLRELHSVSFSLYQWEPWKRNATQKKKINFKKKKPRDFFLIFKNGFIDSTTHKCFLFSRTRTSDPNYLELERLSKNDYLCQVRLCTVLFYFQIDRFLRFYMW